MTLADAGAMAKGSLIHAPFVSLTLALACGALLWGCQSPSTASDSGETRQDAGSGDAGTTDGGMTPADGGTADGGCGAGEVSSGAGCVSAPPFAPAQGMQWSVSFAEEFNGTDYDHDKLTPCFDWNYGDCSSSFNQGREHYLPSQDQVSDGVVHMIAEPLSPPRDDNGCLNGQCTYKSGLLSTARPRADDGSDYLYAFTYGYVEARMKFPATQGFFTAFWMLPADPSFSYRSEIDIVEILGNDPTTLFMTYHFADRSDSTTPNDGQYNNGACAVKDYSQDFVRLGLDWEPDRIAWYIDGVKCGEFTDTANIEDGPMQLILDLMVDHSWQRDWGVGLLDDTLTRELTVDYLRVYQQVPAP